MQKKLVFILCLGLSTALFAAPDEGKPGKPPEEMVRIFFDLFEGRGPVTAVDYIFSNNPYIYEKQDSVGALKEKVSKLENVLGKYRGHILIEDLQFGDTIRTISYLVKYDRQPLRFTFIFYRANRRWVTYQFYFDDPMEGPEDIKRQSLPFKPVVK